MRIRLFRPKTKPFLERVVVRPLVKKDLQALEWDGEFTHFRRLYADSYERMLRGENLMWVAELPGTGLIGQVFIQLNCSQPELADGRNRAYFFSFRVQPAFRNLGLGSLIIKIVEDDLRQRGYSILTLNVAKDNPRARKLYERHGFKVTGQEPGVWSYLDHEGLWRHVNEPAWRMEKKL